MTINEESLRKGFIDEARELIQRLEETVLVLEDDMQDTESIHEIFRVMHTLKGTSGMFGFYKVEKLTHDVENVYQMIREDTLQVDESIINITLKSIDLLHTLIEQNDELSTENEETYNEILKEVAQKYKGEPEEEAIIDEEGASDGIKTKYVYVHYTPSKDIMNRGLNPYIIFENLNYVCKFKTLPAVPEYSQEEEEKLLDEFKNNPTKWDIYCYLKGSYEDLLDEFMFYMDDEYKIFPIDYEAYKPGSDFVNYYNTTHDKAIDTVEVTSIFEELEPSAVIKEVIQVE
ncbi:MAG: Hpt domain-containing protein, partial [Bacteroidales bacterium]|nr:Hpt domain-containing protein [Bacteroidales bacterium]